MAHVTKEELETPRTADEIKPWSEEKLEEVAKSEDGKTAARFRTGHLKELVEETIPLGIFANHHFGDNKSVTLQQVIGNQNHDVIVTDGRGEPGNLKYLEITQAHEGEDAHLRMLKLHEEGHVNAFGSITKTGTKKTGIKIEVEESAVKHSEIVKNEITKIHEAAKRKASKKYPDGTGLVIICDDYVAFHSDEDISQLQKYMKDHIMPILENFQGVYIIGWTGNTYLPFE